MKGKLTINNLDQANPTGVVSWNTNTKPNMELIGVSIDRLSGYDFSCKFKNTDTEVTFRYNLLKNEAIKSCVVASFFWLDFVDDFI